MEHHRTRQPDSLREREREERAFSGSKAREKGLRDGGAAGGRAGRQCRGPSASRRRGRPARDLGRPRHRAFVGPPPRPPPSGSPHHQGCGPSHPLHLLLLLLLRQLPGWLLAHHEDDVPAGRSLGQLLPALRGRAVVQLLLTSCCCQGGTRDARGLDALLLLPLLGGPGPGSGATAPLRCVTAAAPAPPPTDRLTPDARAAGPRPCAGTGASRRTTSTR